MIDESHFNGLKASDLLIKKRCSVCDEKFIPVEYYYHRCPKCQLTFHRYEQQERDEYVTEWNDFDSFDRAGHLMRYKVLNRRLFHTNKVGKEMDQIMSDIIAYDLELWRRNDQ